MARDEDADLRLAMLMERARRAFKLPISEEQTTEERLAAVEQAVTDLCVIVVGIRAEPPSDREPFLSRMEEELLASEKRRGIVPE